MGEPGPARPHGRRSHPPGRTAAAATGRRRSGGRDLADARTYAEVAEAGDVEAQVRLGRLFAVTLDPPDFATARKWWTRAAEAGHAEAQNNLGILLATELDPPELAEARMWWTEAAEAGHTERNSTWGSCSQPS